MPIPQPCADPPVPVCCESWWEIADALSTIAGDAAQACLPACEDFPRYVSHSSPIGGGDYIAVWLGSATPPNITQGRMFVAPKVRYTYNIALCLDGYPMPETGNAGQMLSTPSPAEHNNAAYYSYGVAQAVMRAVINALVASPDSMLGPCCLTGLGSFVPQDPAHGSARWIMAVTIDGPIVWS